MERFAGARSRQMRESRHKAAVSPNPREAASGWVLEAVFPNGRPATITGFGTESEANEWLGSARHVAWLRDARAAFSMPAAVATFAHLSSYAAVLTTAASEFLQTARQAWGRIRQSREYRTIRQTLALLLVLALVCIAGWAQGVGKWASARRPGPVCWRSVRDRFLVAATATLLAVSAVVALFVAMVVILGRSEQPPESGPVTPQMSAARPVVPARSSEVIAISDPIAGLIDRVSSSSEVAAEPPVEAAAKESAPQPAKDDGVAAETPAAAPQHDVQHAAPLGIVGIWAPDTGSCPARNAREGFLPAIISERGARAGKTSCVFKNQRRMHSDWRLLANCTNGRERWKSNVRLSVKGDRLIWTSERGTQAYVRCRSIA
jgi:hypothetical protein